MTDRAAKMPEIFNMRGGQDSYPCWAVRIDRRTKWGNPFVIGKDGTREEVIAKYEAWLRSKPDLMLAVKLELSGKDLLCWCAPLPCHGDVLLRIANTPSEAMKSHGGRTGDGAHGLPTPGSFAGLENREEVIAKPCTNSEVK